MLCTLLLMLPQTIGGQYDPYLSVYGAADWDKLGFGDIAGVGDINGDGTGDFLVGDPFSTQMVANIYSGSDLSVLRSYSNGGLGKFGNFVANAGDTNNDGVSDYLIACPDLTVNGMQWAGEVYLYSGASGSLIFTLQGQSTGQHIGHVGAAGDIDADGYDDFFVGATTEDWGGFSDAGVLYIYSGRTRQVLYQTHGNSDYAFWGRSFGGGFDLNQDGYGDFIAGSGDDNIAIVYSGIDGSVMYTYLASNLSDRLGNAVCLTPDINNDGFPDFAISSFHKAVAGVDGVGEVHLYSGADGSILHILAGESFFDSFGEGIAYVGDVDGNGNPDLAVGSPGTNTLGMINCGSVQVFDMVTGNRIQYAAGSGTDRLLGEHVSWIGDTTGDGKDNVLTSEPRFSSQGLIENGAVHVLDFHPGLAADQVSVSASAGGTVNFAIDFPMHSAGMFYKLLGTQNGTGPTPFAGITLPLTTTGQIWGAMLSQPPPGVFTGAFGTLDSDGNATAQLILPAGFANFLAGSVLHFSAVSVLSQTTLRQSSVAVALTITP